MSLKGVSIVLHVCLSELMVIGACGTSIRTLCRIIESGSAFEVEGFETHYYAVVVISPFYSLLEFISDVKGAQSSTEAPVVSGEIDLIGTLPTASVGNNGKVNHPSVA